MDLLTADLERANSRVVEVERRNEKLRAEIEAVRSGSESTERYIRFHTSLNPDELTSICTRIRALDSQVSDLQSEASRLLRSLDLQKEESQRLAQSATNKQEELEKNNKAWKAELESLRIKVKSYSDYDEIKRELEIMKVCPVWM